MKKLIFISLFFVSISSFGQVNIDSLKKLIPFKKDTALINLQLKIAQEYIDSNVDSTLHYTKLALPLAERINFSKGKLMLNNLLGNCAQRKGSFDEALEFYSEVKKIAEETNDKKGFAMVYNNIAIIHTQRGNYSSAIEGYLKALDYEKELGNKKGIAEAYNNIGVVHYYLRDMDNTLVYLKKSAEITEEIGDVQILKKAYMNIGAIHQYNKEYEEALEFFEKGLELSKAANDLSDITIAHHNIAGVYQEQGKYSEAKLFYDKALAFNEKFDNKRGIALENINLASLFMAQGKFKDTEIFYKKALKLAQKEGYKQIISVAYSGLAKMYDKQGKNELAYDFLLNHILYKDSMVNEENTKAITEMRTKYETAEKEKALTEEQLKSASLAKQAAEAKLAAANRNKWIIVLVALTIAVFLFFMILKQRNKRKAQAEKDAAVIEERDKGTKAIFQAQEDERKRISADLHDGVGQQLSGLKMAFQNISGKIAEENPERSEELKRLSGILSESADEVRYISHQMMPKSLTELGLIDAIEDMLEKSLKLTKIEYEFEYFGIESRLAEQIEISLYRVCQELINNIIKHSEASTVNVQIFKNQGKAILIVEDNGKGMHSADNDGHGLLNMKSRINSIDGEINLEPSPTSGTLATVRVPID